MILQPRELKDLQNLFLNIFSTVSGLSTVVTLCGKNIQDFSVGGRRPETFLAVIQNAAQENWLDMLLRVVFDQTDQTNTATRDRLADLKNLIWPATQQGEPHDHMLTSNLAFVNRDSIRNVVAQVASNGLPSVVALKGTSLAGTSYCWQLINHVARETGDISTVLLDLDLQPNRTPESVMHSIATLAGIEILPTRNDLLRQDGQLDPHSPQLLQSLCQWFIQQAQKIIDDRGKKIWLILDNAHRDTVPPSSKEMIKGLTDLVGSGQVNGLAMFILGCEQTESNSFQVHEDEIYGLGHQDILNFLNNAVSAAGGALGNFANANEAATAITQNVDFVRPDKLALKNLTLQLTELVRSI